MSDEESIVTMLIDEARGQIGLQFSNADRTAEYAARCAGGLRRVGAEYHRNN
jgi:hypothetical protein